MMEEIEKYLKRLTDKNHIIIIPNFGAIVVEKVGKERRFAFNEYITFDDGILEKEYMDGERVPQEEASKQIKSYVHYLNESLSKEGKCEFKLIGLVLQKEKGIYTFTKYEKNKSLPVTKKATTPKLKKDSPAKKEIKKTVASRTTTAKTKIATKSSRTVKAKEPVKPKEKKTTVAKTSALKAKKTPTKSISNVKTTASNTRVRKATKPTTPKPTTPKPTSSKTVKIVTKEPVKKSIASKDSSIRAKKDEKKVVAKSIQSTKASVARASKKTTPSEVLSKQNKELLNSPSKISTSEFHEELLGDSYETGNKTLRYVAAALLILIIGGGVFYIVNPDQVEGLVNREAKKNNAVVEKNDNSERLAYYRSIEDSKKALENISTEIEKSESDEEIELEELNVHIVGGIFESRRNAEKYVNELKGEGLETARVKGKYKEDYYLVVLKSFKDKDEALDDIEELKEYKSSAWIYAEK